MRFIPIGSVLLAACVGVEDELDPSPAEWIEATTVEGYEALSSVGVAPHRGTVRAVNRYGAAVPTDAHDFVVGGASQSVPMDGWGYGGILVTAPGMVEVEGGAVVAELHTVVTDWPGAYLHDAHVVPMPVAAEWGGASSNGMISAADTEVWWAGVGAPPHRVLAADAPLLGMRVRDIDVDGVVDAVAWTAGTVFLLKGRAGGGMGFGGALRAEGLGVGGVDVGDLSGDNLPDIAIGWATQDGSGLLDIWEGDGLFGFEAAEPRDIPAKPVDLLIADSTGEGTLQVTVLHSTANEWTRYIKGAEKQYMPIGPFMPTGGAVFSVGSSLASVGDINDDGAAEVGMLGPRVPGAVRDVFLFDLKTEVENCEAGLAGAQCTPTYLQLEQDLGQFMAFGDGNLDHVEDAWLLEDQARLYAVYYAPESFDSEYQKTGLGQFPDYGPLSVHDADLDGSPEVHIAGPEIWWRYDGTSYLGDPDRFWEKRAGDTKQAREDLIGPVGFGELDGDGSTVDFVGFSVEGGNTIMRSLVFTRGTNRASQLGDVDVDDAGVTPDDLAVCGTNAWVVVAGRVKRVDLSTFANPSVAATAGTTVSRVVCGAGPSGAVGAYLQGGDVVLVDGALNEVDRVAAPGAEDLAFGDFGSGPVVETCTTPGCSITFWPYGSSGDAVFAKGDADDVVIVDSGGTETSIGGRGQLSVGDLDDDGNLDLVGYFEPNHQLSLHRSTGASIAPLEVLHSGSLEGLGGRLEILDGDGDEEPDLWALDTDGNLKYTQPFRPETTPPTPPTPPETGSTGDTGATSG